MEITILHRSIFPRKRCKVEMSLVVKVLEMQSYYNELVQIKNDIHFKSPKGSLLRAMGQAMQEEMASKETLSHCERGPRI